jgi:hypothetical protein
VVLGSAFCVLGLSAAASGKTIAQWNFDSSADGGQTFTDISGNGHDAFFNRPVKLQASDPFDPEGAESKNQSVVESVNKKGSRTNARVDNVDSIDLTVNKKFTIEGWIKPDKPPAYGFAEVVQIMSSEGGTSIFFVGINQEGQAVARVYARGAGSKSFTSQEKAPLNQWTHLALVYDGSDATLYINGKEAAKQHIGRRLPKKLSRIVLGSGVLGAIDDVRISDEALPADQLGFKKTFTGQEKEAGSAASKPTEGEAGQK